MITSREVFDIKNIKRTSIMFVVHLLQFAITFAVLCLSESSLFAGFAIGIVVALGAFAVNRYICISAQKQEDLSASSESESYESETADSAEVEENVLSITKSDNEPAATSEITVTDRFDDGVSKEIYELGQEIYFDSEDVQNIYTEENEEMLINLIMLGKESEALAMINGCFDRVSSDPSGEAVNYFVTNIVRTFVKLIANIKINKNDSKYKFDNMLGIVKANTIGEKRTAIADIVISLCTETQKIRDDREESISKRVKVYVEENFSDRELDVSKISDHLGLSASYATRLFKQETGEVLSYYINKVRVSKARELLVLDLYRIEQIAHMVGYLDSRALSRAFKRFYGVTPSQYKEISYIEANTGI